VKSSLTRERVGPHPKKGTNEIARQIRWSVLSKTCSQPAGPPESYWAIKRHKPREFQKEFYVLVKRTPGPSDLQIVGAKTGETTQDTTLTWVQEALIDCKNGRPSFEEI